MFQTAILIVDSSNLPWHCYDARRNLAVRMVRLMATGVLWLMQWTRISHRKSTQKSASRSPMIQLDHGTRFNIVPSLVLFQSVNLPHLRVGRRLKLDAILR